MASLLHRLGGWAFDRRATVVVAWLLLLAVVGTLAGAFGKTADAQLSIPGVESVTATELLQERFPQSAIGGAGARIVFAAPAGTSVTDPENRTAIENVLDRAAAARRSAPSATRSRRAPSPRTAGWPSRRWPTPPRSTRSPTRRAPT